MGFGSCAEFLCGFREGFRWDCEAVYDVEAARRMSSQFLRSVILGGDKTYPQLNGISATLTIDRLLSPDVNTISFAAPACMTAPIRWPPVTFVKLALVSQVGRYSKFDVSDPDVISPGIT